MAQMRAAVRAYVATDPEPTGVMGKLDQMFALYSMTQLVTVVVALIDPGDDTLRLCNAGHLPPLLIDAERAPQLATTPDK